MLRSVLAAACCLLAPSAMRAQESPIDFGRDIHPILADRCFTCHGPDAAQRKAELRLDEQGSAMRAREHGTPVVPHAPQESELLRRVTATGKDRMPPEGSGRAPLSDEEVRLLTQWIAQGAPWGEHWSFVPPRRPTPPPGASHPVDAFVRARLAREGLRPAAPASRAQLLRRASFDLTGLPPTPAELRAFVDDEREGAFARVVDRLLASPAYGERMAMSWLDAARYSDTDGYQQDAVRNNWPWRDWVVAAYNSNMPFDRFTTEQLAGDLLPKASADQILATCFHRNHMTNGEGGRHPEESRVDYVIDRVNTLGTVWLGLTVGCAQCHDHKYDPIAQDEYYSLSAFFDSIDEDGRAGNRAKPYLQYKSPLVKAGLRASEAWLEREQSRQAAIEARARRGFDPWLTEALQRIRRKGGHQSFHAAKSTSSRSQSGVRIEQDEDFTYVVSGPNERHEDYVIHVRPTVERITAMRLSVLPVVTETGGRLSLGEDGHILLTNLKLSVRAAARGAVRQIEIAHATADHQYRPSGEIYGPVRAVLDDDPRSGWWTRGRPSHEARHAVFALRDELVLAADEVLVVELRHRSLSGHANLRRFRLSFTDERGPATRTVGPTPREVLAMRESVEELRKNERDDLLEEYYAGLADVQRVREDVARARLQRDSYRRYENKPVGVMVLGERKKRRKTHVLVRGVWDQRGKEVQPRIPAAIGGRATKPRSRLDLAAWLTSPSNPLTARVAVNRYWQMLFGHGLVRTPEDFGVQGKRPTHPELLDWLAVEFVESGWDVKHILRTIVTSETYRQSSTAPTDTAAELAQRDPANHLLARQSRFRLPSAMIRDAALASSGLLVSRLGGPPVHPPQPAGVWADSTMGRLRYRASVGEDRYRRSLYTFWRRLIAPTAMFDAPKRRLPRVRPVRTNTPTQALTVMNDDSFVDASVLLARQLLRARSAATPDDTTLDELFTRVLSRTPDDHETSQLLRSLDGFRAAYREDPDGALRLTQRLRGTIHERGVPSSKSSSADVTELAAWSMLAGLVYNLDEALTRQ